MAYTGDKKREYDKKRAADRRAFHVERMGGKCVQCGSTDRLEFDHIDRSTKAYNPTQLWSRTEAVVLAELEKTQLLCHDCHQKKTSAERIADRNLQHGEYGMYKWYKCRCQPCRDANAERVRMQRAGISMRKPKK